MGLLDELAKLGATLSPSELARGDESDRMIGAIVKVLEHQGVTVAEELFPTEVKDAEAVAAAAPAVTAEAANALEKLLARFEAAVHAAEGKDTTPAPVAPEPIPLAPVAPPAPEPVDQTPPLILPVTAPAPPVAPPAPPAPAPSPDPDAPVV